MNVALILKLIPWTLVKDVVFAVLELVVDDTDNDFDNTIVDAAKKSLEKAEIEFPDK